MGVLRDLTAILPLAIGIMGITLSGAAVSILLEQKACSPWVQPPINDFICNDTSVLAQISEIVSTRGTLRSVCSSLSSAAFGYWRDVTGLSRPLLYIGAVAEMVAASAYLLAALDWGANPWVAPLMEAVVSGLFGEGVMSLGANCLVMAKSSHEDRTMSIQIYMTVTLLASLAASSTGGFLLTAVGFCWYFGVVIFLHFLSLVSSLTLVTEAERRPGQMVGTTFQQLSSVFKARENFVVIWLMILCGSLIFNTFSAEINLSFYYNQQKFHFTVRENTVFGTYHFMASIIGSFLMAVLLVKVLKWSDFKVGIAGSILTIVYTVSMGLANSKIVLILLAPLNCMRLNLFTIPQAIISKCISKHELGLFIGVGSLTMLWVPFCISFTYNHVFSETSKTMPGAFYFVTAVCYIIITILFIFGAFFYKKSVSLEAESSEVSENLVQPTEDDIEDSPREENA